MCDSDYTLFFIGSIHSLSMFEIDNNECKHFLNFVCTNCRSTLHHLGRYLQTNATLHDSSYNPEWWKISLSIWFNSILEWMKN